MTCHRNVTRDSRVTTPVSHATHTTPHHTLSLAEVVGGLSVAKKSSIGSVVEGPRRSEKRMAADAAKIRGPR